MTEKRPMVQPKNPSGSAPNHRRNRNNRNMQRGKKQKRARFNIVGCIGRIVLLLVVCLGIWFFLQSNVFTVKTVEVRGNERVSSEDIIALAAIETGGNLFDVDRKEAAERVKMHSAINKVIVNTRPFHKILITVEERTAVGWIAAEEGYYLLDDKGYIFMQREDYNDYLPLITGLTLPNALSTGLSLNDVKGIEDVLEVSNAFSDYYRGQMRELHYTQKGNFVFFIGDLKIRLGKNEKVWKKRRVIDALLEKIPASRLDEVEYIDVSSPDNPVVSGYDIAYEERKAKEEEKAKKEAEKNQETKNNSQTTTDTTTDSSGTTTTDTTTPQENTDVEQNSAVPETQTTTVDGSNPTNNGND